MQKLNGNSNAQSPKACTAPARWQSARRTFAVQEVEDIGEYMRAWRAKWKRVQGQSARLADNLPPVTNGR